MFAHFRFIEFSRHRAHDFQSRLRATLGPRKPRHRLLRFVLGMAGLALVGVLVLVGVVVGAAMLVARGVYKLLVRRDKPIARDARIVDAEYRVVDKPLLTR